MSRTLFALRVLILIGALGSTIQPRLLSHFQNASLISDGVWQPIAARDSGQNRGLRLAFTAIGIILLFAE